MSTILITTIICFCFGAIIGSFLSVCVYRLPHGKYEPERQGIKVLAHPVSIADPPRSFCPNCEKQLRWYHNIPLASWLMLRGRCEYCKEPIPFRYFFLELTTALLCVACYYRFGLTPGAALAFAFVCTMLVITFIDIDYMIIPDVISYPGIFVGIGIGLINQLLPQPLFEFPFVQSVLDSFLGVLGGAGVLLAVYWIYRVVRKREGLGLGDVKLLAMIGTIFGWQCAWFTIFAGSIAGSVLGILIALISRKGFSNYLPFGPYLVMGVLIFIFDVPLLYHYFTTPDVAPPWWILAELK